MEWEVALGVPLVLGVGAIPEIDGWVEESPSCSAIVGSKISRGLHSHRMQSICGSTTYPCKQCLLQYWWPTQWSAHFGQHSPSTLILFSHGRGVQELVWQVIFPLRHTQLVQKSSCVHLDPFRKTRCGSSSSQCSVLFSTASSAFKISRSSSISATKASTLVAKHCFAVHSAV